MGFFQDSNFICAGRLDSYVCTYIPGDYYYFFFGDDVQYTLTGENIIERQL